MAAEQERKKALILTTVSGFVQKFERENVRLLQEMGYEVHYAANPDVPAYLYPAGTYEEMEITFHPIPIIQDPRAIRENQKAYQELKHLIRDHHISLLHCHTPVGGVLGRLLGRSFGKSLTVIYTAHGFHFYKEKNKLIHPLAYRVEKWLAHYTDALVTINWEDYRAAKKFRLRCPGNVFRINGAGIDPMEFQPVTKEEYRETRKQLGIGKDTFYMVSVGELNQNKNHISILKALAWLRIKGNDLGNMRCDIYGQGRERKALEEQIRTLHLEDVVQIHEYVNPVRPALAGADVFLFPSIREGLGLAAVEALATGLPVIAAENRGSREYMRNNVNGFTFPSDDIERFGMAILHCMLLDEAEKEQMRNEAISSVKPFLKDIVRDRMKEIYQKVEQR